MLLFIVTSCGTLINPRYVKLSNKNQERLKPDLLNSTKEFYEFYEDKNDHEQLIADANGIRDIVQHSKYDLSLVVFYAFYCGPCRAQMPSLDQLHRNNDDKIQLLYISTADWANLKEDLNYLKKSNVHASASLGVDIYKYGTEFRQVNRLYSLAKDLGLDAVQILGFPTYILVNRSFEVLYFSHSISDTDFQELINL